MKNGIHSITVGQNCRNDPGGTDHQHSREGRGHALHKLGNHLIDRQTTYQGDDNAHIQEDRCDLTKPPAMLQHTIDHYGKPGQHHQQYQHGALVHAFQFIQGRCVVHFTLLAVGLIADG